MPIDKHVGVTTMKAKIAALTAACGLALTAGGAKAESIGYNLQAFVPVACSLRFEAAPSVSADGTARLGMLREYCNAPNGYQILLNYSAGSLRGAVVSVGAESIILDGSGQAIVPGALGPKIQTRDLAITPGAGGFDASSFNLAVQVS
ncbi:hypothetical protein [Sphingopyxis sp.]|uniref:hypothetical protein n=1 Tax=Sphingopyxis sp. TaxID=1908224 RepID=UPI0035B092CB